MITLGHEFTSVGIVIVSGVLHPKNHTGQQGRGGPECTTAVE